MTSGDYGHELIFGTFTTPSSEHPERVVELARVAERAGLDLATYQDHPYHPGLLDAWTLLSYLAAATSRIRLAANVLNLPLRQPVVVARSAASLDLLSGGRVELGLGAGAFWDAIAAAGGPRRTPRESVEALDEAISVIREVWSTSTRGGVRVDGSHYRVHGAKRGPAPAHDIGIWVGAYKPRMLRLVGRAADGWLPSLPYLENGASDLTAMNAHIDEGATASGRDPASVRRLLNLGGQFTPTGSGFLVGPPAQWVEELASLALDDGISGFILTADDPATIERFAAEVAPAVRDLVAAERSRNNSDDPDGGTGDGSGGDSDGGSDGGPGGRSGGGPGGRSGGGAGETGGGTSGSGGSRGNGGSGGTSGSRGTSGAGGGGGSGGNGGSGGTSVASPSVPAGASGVPSALRVTPTPPPGARLGERRVWDEGSRPAAPPAPAGQVYTNRGRAVGQHLVDVHDHLRRELTEIRDVLDQVVKGSTSPGDARAALNQMTVRQNNWTLGAYCAAYCTVVTQHHGLEDGSIFPHLRAADAGLAPVLDRLAQEHVAIHELVEGVDGALVRLVSSPGDYDELRSAVDTLTDALLSHLSYEEAQIVEPLARHGFFPGQV